MERMDKMSWEQFEEPEFDPSLLGEVVADGEINSAAYIISDRRVDTRDLPFYIMDCGKMKTCDFRTLMRYPDRENNLDDVPRDKIVEAANEISNESLKTFLGVTKFLANNGMKDILFELYTPNSTTDRLTTYDIERLAEDLEIWERRHPTKKDIYYMDAITADGRHKATCQIDPKTFLVTDPAMMQFLKEYGGPLLEEIIR